MKDYFLNLLNFSDWTNRRLLEVLLGASEIPERAQELFCHLICARRIWHCRLVGENPKNGVWDRFEVQNWAAELEVNRSLTDVLFEQLRPETLDEIIQYKTTTGVAFETSRADILTHILIHEAYHHGQINSLIKPFVTKPADIMYISYVREKRLPL